MRNLFHRGLALLLNLSGVIMGNGAEAEENPETMDLIPQEAPILPDVEMALLYEERTDTLLYAKSIFQVNPPASMTKVMTAMLVLEHDPTLSGTMVVPPEAVSPEFCYWLEDIHLLPGEELKVRTLMDYLLIASGNEAATTLAVYVDGDIPTFIDRMNAKARELGMTQTFYGDPHGLCAQSRITANDMLILARYAMKNRLFREIVATKSGEISPNHVRSELLSYNNTNRVMAPRQQPAYETEFTDQVIGIKTGFITPAGFNLSSCMVKDDLTFYGVVMHGKEIIVDGEELYTHHLETIKLFRYARTFEKQGFEAGEQVTTVTVGSLKKAELSLKAEEDCFVLVKEGEKASLEIRLESLRQGIQKGQRVGTLSIHDAFGNVKQTALLASRDIQTKCFGLIAQ